MDISLKAICNNLLCPFDFNNDKNVLYFKDIDPDPHYFNSIYNNIVDNCEYYIQETFSKRVDKNQVASDSFSLFRINICSLPKYLLEFQSHLNH